MKLSKNFSLTELTKTQVRNKDNTPTDEQVNNLKTLTAKVLQPIRDKHGAVTVSSAFRSVAVNKAVGGSGTSDHCKGMAADIEVAGLDNRKLAEWIAANLKFTQLILEFYSDGVPDSGWVHVSYDENNLKNQTMRAIKVAGKTKYIPGL